MPPEFTTIKFIIKIKFTNILLLSNYFFLDVCVHQGSSSVQMTNVSLQAECVMDTEIAPLEQMKQSVQVEVKTSDSTNNDL